MLKDSEMREIRGATLEGLLRSEDSVLGLINIRGTSPLLEEFLAEIRLEISKRKVS